MPGPPPNGNVTRDEFESLRQSWQHTDAIVQRLFTLAEATSENVDSLAGKVDRMAEKQAAMGVQRGIPVTLLVSCAGLLLAVIGTASALVVSHLNGTIAPLKELAEGTQEDLKSLSGRVSANTTQQHLTALRQEALSVENETQHKWIRDTVCVQFDWHDRWIRATVDAQGKVVFPPPGYTPLSEVGNVSPITHRVKE